jgi:hypothetical protein
MSDLGFQTLNKNSYRWTKNLGFFMEVWNTIWNTFYVGNFFQISMYFELIKRF